MKYLVKKDIKIRNKQKILELKNFCLKFFIIYTLNLSKIKNNLFFYFKFFSLQKFNSKDISKYNKSKIVRRCILTGRNRGSIRSVGNVSRSPLKDLFSMGLIPGYKKAIW
jgi:ribosomal protein S14